MEKEYSVEELAGFNKDVIEFNKATSDYDCLKDCPDDVRYQVELAANGLLKKALEHDRFVTDFMTSTFKDNSYLVELEHRLKGRKRLTEKIYQRMLTTGNSIDNICDGISDLMRFTVILDFDNYTALLDNYLKRIENNEEISIYRMKNRWNNWCCKDISCKFMTNDGFVFEVQFHTEQSYVIKERLARQCYIARRRNDCPDDILKKATLLTKYYMDSVIVPEGAKDYTFNGGRHV